MLFENFYEDSRGNERSAGVAETTAEELANVIINHHVFGDKNTCLVWDTALQILWFFFENNSSMHIIFASDEERLSFVSRFPTVKYFQT